MAAYAAVKYICSLSPYGLDKSVIGNFDRFFMTGTSKYRKWCILTTFPQTIRAEPSGLAVKGTRDP